MKNIDSQINTDLYHPTAPVENSSIHITIRASTIVILEVQTTNSRLC